MIERMALSPWDIELKQMFFCWAMIFCSSLLSWCEKKHSDEEKNETWQQLLLSIGSSCVNISIFCHSKLNFQHNISNNAATNVQLLVVIVYGVFFYLLWHCWDRIQPITEEIRNERSANSQQQSKDEKLFKGYICLRMTIYNGTGNINNNNNRPCFGLITIYDQQLLAWWLWLHSCSLWNSCTTAAPPPATAERLEEKKTRNVWPDFCRNRHLCRLQMKKKK